MLLYINEKIGIFVYSNIAKIGPIFRKIDYKDKKGYPHTRFLVKLTPNKDIPFPILIRINFSFRSFRIVPRFRLSFLHIGDFISRL